MLYTSAVLVALLAHRTTFTASMYVMLAGIRKKRKVVGACGKRRGTKIGRRRVPLDWHEYLRRPHMTERRFQRLFRMRRGSFDALVTRLETHWDTTRPRKGGKTWKHWRISPTLHLAITLRYLAGGSLLDISEMYNVWDSTLYKCLKRTIEAICCVFREWPLVAALDAPTDAPLRALSEGFRARSHHNMGGIIGAIDGLLIPIKAPRGERNAKAYHCRKGFFAVNVQGICDASYRITYASIARAPGAVHDSYAWSLDPLHKRIHGDTPTNNMLKRRGFYLIGDDAYRCSHTLAAPWPGKWGADSPQCAYNYHHSSARMAIEQTFGMLSRKWLLLKRPYEGGLRRTPEGAGIYQTIMACLQLVRGPPGGPPSPAPLSRYTSISHPRRTQHNYCIDAGDSDGHVDADDREGRRDSDLPPGDRTHQRYDHRWRARGLDPGVVHTTGPNQRAARTETDRREQRLALEPAWYEDTRLSPRDPLYHIAATPGAHQAALCSPRAAVTARMDQSGQIRPPERPVHW